MRRITDGLEQRYRKSGLRADEHMKRIEELRDDWATASLVCPDCNGFYDDCRTCNGYGVTCPECRGGRYVKRYPTKSERYIRPELVLCAVCCPNGVYSAAAETDAIRKRFRQRQEAA